MSNRNILNINVGSSTATSNHVLLDKWKNKHYSLRVQAHVISFLLNKVDYYEKIAFDLPFYRLVKECSDQYNVSKTTINRWWQSFQLYGELPYETSEYLSNRVFLYMVYTVYMYTMYIYFFVYTTCSQQ